MKKGKDIMLTVIVNTHNHELYLRDTFDGILMQKTEYAFNVAVADGGSTDSTLEIIRSYVEAYPDIFYIWRDDFLESNYAGKYIALCEGDDYWLDPEKLEKQISYMEAHPECPMCLAQGVELNCRTGKLRLISGHESDCDVTPRAFFLREHGGDYATASYLMKTEVFKVVSDRDVWFIDGKVGDTLYVAKALSMGNIHYMNDTVCVYRKYHSGSWSDKQYTPQRNAARRKYLTGLIWFYYRYNRMTKGKCEPYVSACYKFYLQMFAVEEAEARTDAKEFAELCENADRDSKGDMSPLWKKISDNYNAFNGAYLTDDKRKELEKYEHILIWGAGNLAKKLAAQFKEKEMKFDGFVVSDGYPVPADLEKPVWHMSDVPFDFSNTAVIIAMCDKWTCLLDEDKMPPHVDRPFGLD